MPQDGFYKRAKNESALEKRFEKKNATHQNRMSSKQELKN